MSIVFGAVVVIDGATMLNAGSVPLLARPPDALIGVVPLTPE